MFSTLGLRSASAPWHQAPSCGLRAVPDDGRIEMRAAEVEPPSLRVLGPQHGSRCPCRVVGNVIRRAGEFRLARRRGAFRAEERGSNSCRRLRSTNFDSAGTSGVQLTHPGTPLRARAWVLRAHRELTADALVESQPFGELRANLGGGCRLGAAACDEESNDRGCQRERCRCGQCADRETRAGSFPARSPQQVVLALLQSIAREFAQRRWRRWGSCLGTSLRFFMSEGRFEFPQARPCA